MNKIQTDNHLSWIGGCEKEDANVCLKKAKKLKIDLIIVDNYSLGFEWEQTIQNNNIKVFVIDDFFDRKHACNYYLNQNIETLYFSSSCPDSVTLSISWYDI